jgi:tetratricopeptide (TPR) repeat protein
VLAYGGLLALLAAAIARTRRLPPGAERDLSVALLAAVAAWLVHGFYDWDWNIPAVTAPVLVMLGLLGGRPVNATAAAPGPAPPRAIDRPAVRGALVGVATLAAAAAVVSAGLPWLAASKADSAAEAATGRSAGALQRAAAEADLAARLNPLATRPLFVAAAIAYARGRLLETREALLEAADRSPDDPQVWFRLGSLALQLADREGYVQATMRQFRLDPRNPLARGQSERALLFLTPAASSATATGTPLRAATG